MIDFEWDAFEVNGGTNAWGYEFTTMRCRGCSSNISDVGTWVFGGADGESEKASLRELLTIATEHLKECHPDK